MANLTKIQLKTLVNNQAQVIGDFTTSHYNTVYPFRDKVTNEYKLATALVMTQSNIAESKEHVTVLAFDGENYHTWCGDSLLEGKMGDEDAKELVETVANLIPEQKREVFQSEMLNLWNGHDLNTGCNNSRLASNFERALAAGDDIDDITSGSSAILCKHIKNMFAQMPEFDEVTRNLEKLHKDALKVSRTTKTDSIIEDAISNFGFQGEALFVAGPGGHGKTHTIKSMAEKDDYNFVELQGHGQIEAIDMYGYDKKHGDQFVWFDGPISQAARSAASGIKTILFIDEFTNIPMRETAGLKASFEPYKGNYYFETSRISSITDGIAVMEKIVVPVENLQIVAAANIGSGYASEEVDKALKQRFMIIHYVAKDSKVQSVLDAICKEKSFSASLSTKLMQFKTLMEQKVEEGLIPEAPTMRHLSRKFLGLMKEEDDLETVALTQILQFVEFDVDGTPVVEQVEMIEEIIDATLGA